MTDQNSGDPQKGQSFSGVSLDDNPAQSTKTDINIDEVLRRDRHAQEHIKRLEQERKEDRERLTRLEAELAKARTVDDLMERMRQGNNYRSDDEPTSRTEDKQTIDVDTLVSATTKVVLNQLSEKEIREAEQRNFMEALSVLEQKHGSKAMVDTKVEQRAQELGLTIEDMARTARRSPKAFFELMGEKEVRVPSSTQGSVTNYKGPQEMTAAEMMQLRKDPKQRKTWQDPEYQRQLRLKILEESRKKSNQG